MRIFFFTLFVGVLLCGGCSTPKRGHDTLTLWYDAPAEQWEQTLPLGNGRLGAMPDGGVAQEKLVLNDISLWSGSEEDVSNPEAIRYLPRVRQLLLDGRNLEAQDMMYKHFVCGGGGSASPCYGCFQTLGALNFDFGLTGVATGYERGLKLSDASAYTRFEIDGVEYEREYFVLRGADVVAVRLRASKPGALNFSFSLARPENAEVASEDAALVMRGRLPSGVEEVPGMGYLAKAAVRCVGGEVEYQPQRVCVSNADEAVVFVSASTSWWGEEYERQVDSLLQNALTADFEQLRAAHTTDYKHYFDRVSLDLGQPTEDLPTDVRLMRFDSIADPSFAALYMQYGRYLMISSTREGSLPPNLQGLWANGVTTPWNGDYHLNINVEMNHWITGPGNLSELQQPLIEYTKQLVPSGERTSRDFYGTKGWCAHVVANPWNFTAPAEDPSWGATNTGGAWLAQHVWEQYRFTADTAYLREVYPVLRGAAEFFLENLIAEPEHGWLVTAPTSSPENGFYDESHERVTFVCMGSTMDNQIVRELFGAVCQSAAILGVDTAFATRLEEAANRLAPNQVNDKGCLMEWLRDYKEEDIHHRHVSHLFGLYPGDELTPRKTPELMDACRATLNRRGDEGTGWSRAWKICFWARLGDGNRAYKLLKSLLQPAGTDWGAGGTYPNLFCAHPPFQIDGNFGGAAGIAEMLLQSHDGCIEVLPARPDAWPDGEYRGLKARGDVTVDCRWREGRVRSVTLCSGSDQTITLVVPGQESPMQVVCRAGVPQQFSF